MLNNKEFFFNSLHFLNFKAFSDSTGSGKFILMETRKMKQYKKYLLFFINTLRILNLFFLSFLFFCHTRKVEEDVLQSRYVLQGWRKPVPYFSNAPHWNLLLAIGNENYPLDRPLSSTPTQAVQIFENHTLTC